MADNFTLNAGTGGVDLWTDEVAGPVHAQIVKLADGTADSTTVIASGGGVEASALRVTIASDSTGVVSVDDGGGALTVDGTVTANLSATDNAVLDAIAASVAGTVTVDGSGVTQPVSGTVTANLSATDNAVLDAIDAVLDAINAKLVTGTVIGDVNLGATDNAVLDAIAASVGGTLTVDGSGVTQPVSGTVTANLSATDNAVLDVIESNTSAGVSHYRNPDANAEAEIKGSAGTLHWMHVMNLTAALAYLHLYDATAAAVTPGTTTPTYTFPIPTQGDTNGAGFTLPLGGQGQAFANGITLVCTTTIDGSAGDPGTNGVFVNAGYT